MNPYDFVHLALHALGREVKGKTKLQKTIYFLGVLTDSVGELGYFPHYYGPYSQDVADAVKRLVALGFVDQNFVGTGGVNEFGFEVGRYDYRLNEQGTQLAKLKARGRYADVMSKLEHAVETLTQAGELDYMKLSIAAKTYFMLGNRERTSMRELAQLASDFGWSVDENQVKEAGEYLQKLGLVQLVNGE